MRMRCSLAHVHHSPNGPGHSQVGAERSYKDSERPAPDAVQSVNLQPLKRAKGTRKIHAHGPATHDPAMPRAEATRISEKWRLRLEARKGNEQPPPDDLLGGATTGTPAGEAVGRSLAQVRPKGGAHYLQRKCDGEDNGCPAGTNGCPAGTIACPTTCPSGTTGSLPTADEDYSLEQFQTDLA